MNEAYCIKPEVAPAATTIYTHSKPRSFRNATDAINGLHFCQAHEPGERITIGSLSLRHPQPAENLHLQKLTNEQADLVLAFCEKMGDNLNVLNQRLRANINNGQMEWQQQEAKQLALTTIPSWGAWA